MPESVRPIFRDPSAYAIATVAALAAGAAFDGGMFLFLLKHAHDGVTLSDFWVKIHLLVRIAAACGFLTWFDRMYANVGALHGSEYPRWWAMGGFIIPPFALFRPCEIAAEIWRRNSPRDDQPVLVYLWWAAFLNALVLTVLGRETAAHFVAVASAAAAMAMVKILTTRMEAARLATQMEERRTIREARAASRRPMTAEPSNEIAAPAEGSTNIAPHLAAIEAAAAARVAERRGRGMTPSVPAPSPESPLPPSPLPRDVVTRDAVQSSALPQPLQDAQQPRGFRPVKITGQQRRLPNAMLRIRLLATVFAIAGVAMLAMAVHAAFEPGQGALVLGGVYAIGGLAVLLSAAFSSRYRTTSATPENWTMIAIAGLLVAAANIFVIAGTIAR